MGNEPPNPSAPAYKRDIPGRIGAALTVLLALILGDAVDVSIGRSRLFGSDVPNPDEGWFFSFLDRFTPWLNKLVGVEPPKPLRLNPDID